jgi:hypothetical protein
MPLLSTRFTCYSEAHLLRAPECGARGNWSDFWTTRADELGDPFAREIFGGFIGHLRCSERQSRIGIVNPCRRSGL